MNSGDAGSMAKAVERELAAILGKAKGESLEVGEKELKLLKDRNRLLLDVSSLLPSPRTVPCSLLLVFHRSGPSLLCSHSLSPFRISFIHLRRSPSLSCNA